MTRTLAVVLLGCLLTGAGCFGARPVREVARTEATVSRPRALALGATVVEIFQAAGDGCISGRGKLDLQVNCIPNFGSLELSDVAVEDPSIVSATLEPRSAAGSLDRAAVTLRALAVGRTTLRAHARVGLSSSTIELPLEVEVPDRVTVEGFDGLQLAGRFSSGLAHAFRGERELAWDGLALLTLEGPGALRHAGKGWALETSSSAAGQRGRLTSPYDPRVSVPFELFALSEVSLKVDVLPEEKCRRVVLPSLTVRGKPVGGVFSMGSDVVVDVKYPFDTCAPYNPPAGPVSSGVALSWTGGGGECRVEVSIRGGEGPHTRVETVVALARPCAR